MMIAVTIIGIILLIILALMLYGASYEFVASRRATSDYAEPPGEFITVEDRQVHINIMGERTAGQPVVILEASVGANSLDWQRVQPLIAESAMVMSYDRAGNGWSDKHTGERSAETLASELRTILQTTNIAPPYVLVGHRYGGMYVRKYQELYPEDVAGLVLVDASHPTLFAEEDNSAEIKRLETNVNIYQKFGVVRAVTRRNYRVAFLDGEEKERYIAMMMHDNPNLLQEARPVLEDGITLPDKIDVPLMVISRGEDDDIARERKWAERQRDLVTLSDNSQHIYAESTKSWIVFAEPQTIADGVLSIVEQLSQDNSKEA